MSIFKILKFILLTLVLLFILYVFTANTQDITLKVFPLPVYIVQYPLSSILFISFLLGFMIVGVYAVVEIFKLNRRVRKLKKQNILLEQEVSNLRKEPLESAVSAKASGSEKEYDDYDSPLDEETYKRIR